MYSPFMHGFGAAAFGAFGFMLVIGLLWSFVWKGLALWSAARNKQLLWFVVLLIVNTFGILEIVYLLFFRADRETRSFASLFDMHGMKDRVTKMASVEKKESDLPVAESSPAGDK